MESLDRIYKGRFFARRHKLNWRVPYVCEAIRSVLLPHSLIDVGCATGDFVNGFLKMGIDAYGLEGTENVLDYMEIPRHRMLVHDMRFPIDNKDVFDVAVCLEVAEHIEEEYCDVFLDNLVSLSNRIVMSYAPPGQGGHYHVNCQEQLYWMQKMAHRGMHFHAEVRDGIKRHWEPVARKKEMSSYYNHLLYFESVS